MWPSKIESHQNLAQIIVIPKRNPREAALKPAAVHTSLRAPFPGVAAVGDAWPAVDNIDVLRVVVGFIAETVT
jgi:hypothetical protein